MYSYSNHNNAYDSLFIENGYLKQRLNDIEAQHE